jgi:Fic family protein
VRGRFEERVWEYRPDLYAPAAYRKACPYQAFVPDGLTGERFSLPADLSGVVSDAEGEIRALNSSAVPALAPLARLLLRTESIASSKVEGMAVEARSLARAEAKADLGANVSATAAEVLANIDAMSFAVEEATADPVLRVSRLVEIHHILMNDTNRPEIAGQIRAEQNWIGGNDYNPCGADFVPPPESEVRPLLEDLCAFGNEQALPPLVQAALAHAQFETIHPFIDGNGRTGRALIHVLLRRRGLAPSYVPPISVLLARNKAAYIAGLTAFREGDLALWLERFSVAAAQSAALARRYLDSALELKVSWRQALAASPTAPRADAAAWALIDVLVGQPVVNLPVAVALTGRVKSSVNAAIGQLVNVGVLIPLSEAARNRSWEAAGLLDLIAGLEGG